MGGAQDRQQQIVSEDLMKKKATLKQMIEDGTPGLYICGAYQFLGKYYKDANGTIIPGLSIFDLYTENPGLSYPRLIGNIAIHTDLRGLRHATSEVEARTIVGFENHGGRTYLGKGVKLLGKVIKGFGNNGDLPAMLDGRQVQAGDRTEGAAYKNSFGSYLHGPILPKNPEFADLLIRLALEKKYLPRRKAGDSPTINLSPLDDSLEWKAHNFIVKRTK